MLTRLVALEEHNEAFFAWYYARDAGWVDESENILLHVDEHADLQLPRTRRPIPRRFDPVAAADYTYTAVDIASFIWPAAYCGIFQKIYWVRREHDSNAGAWRRVGIVYSEHGFPRPWSYRSDRNLDPLKVKEGEVALEYAPLNPGDRLRPSAPLVLDIDLDYFRANYPPDVPRWALRVEETFAREVKENPYHLIKVLGNGLAVEQNASGEWLLVPSEETFFPPQAPDNRDDEEVIAEALQRLGEYLDKFQLKPALVTLCRSEYSGYTPKQHARRIEQGVRELLERRYTIKEHSLNDLLPDGWKVPNHLLRKWPW